MDYIACLAFGFLCGFAVSFQLAVLLLGAPSPLKEQSDDHEVTQHP